MSQAGSAVWSGGDARVVADEAGSSGIDLNRGDAGVGSKVQSVAAGEGGVDIQLGGGRAAFASVEPTDVDHAVLVGRDGGHEALSRGYVIGPDGHGEGEATRRFRANKCRSRAGGGLVGVDVIDKTLARNWTHGQG